MSRLIRLAAGQVSAYDLLTTDSYLLHEWTRLSDMRSSVSWSASQPELGLLTEHVQGLGKGSGGFYGGASGIVEFFVLTPQMRDYLEATILGGNGIAEVTAYLHNPRFADNDGFAVYQGELLSPYIANADSSHTRFNDVAYTNNQYLFRRGTLIPLPVLASISGLVITALDGTYVSYQE